MKRIVCLVTLLWTLGMAQAAFSQVLGVPQKMNFQAHVYRPDNTPVPDGTYSFRFSLWTAVLGGAEVWTRTENVPVRNGTLSVLFTSLTAADFVSDRYLDIQMGADSLLVRRIHIASVAHAFKVDSVADSGIVYSSFANGVITKNKFAAGVVDPTKWLLEGNTADASDYLGTSNDKPLALRTNNKQAALYTFADNTNVAFRSINIQSGSQVNVIDTGLVGVTIGGGGQDNFSGIDSDNGVYATFGTIGGGLGQRVTDFAGTVPGGQRNDAKYYAVAAGGSDNWSRQYGGSIGGGAANYLLGFYAAVPGGLFNRAHGDYSLAAGALALTTLDGTFVWSDAANFDFSPTASNQFAVRTQGGVRFITAINGSGGQTAGVTLSAADSGWNSLSDRNAKTAPTPFDSETLLNRLLALPVSGWNYRSRTDIPHLGPMAQDFYSAFGLGTDARHISMVDADGTALAAIQGLNRRLEAKRRRIAVLQAENTALQKRLDALSLAVNQLVKQPRK